MGQVPGAGRRRPAGVAAGLNQQTVRTDTFWLKTKLLGPFRKCRWSWSTCHYRRIVCGQTTAAWPGRLRPESKESTASTLDVRRETRGLWPALVSLGSAAHCYWSAGGAIILFLIVNLIGLGPRTIARSRGLCLSKQVRGYTFFLPGQKEAALCPLDQPDLITGIPPCSPTCLLELSPIGFNGAPCCAPSKVERAHPIVGVGPLLQQGLSEQISVVSISLVTP